MRIAYVALIIAGVLCVAGSAGAWDFMGGAPFPRMSATPPAEPTGSKSVEKLSKLWGNRFNEEYMPVAYQVNSDIVALASVGKDKCSDRNLRVFARKIGLERLDVMQNLRSDYNIFASRVMPEARLEPPALMLRSISGCCGHEFDCAWVGYLIELMRESHELADLAVEKTDIPQLLQQSRVVARTNYNEANALKRWQMDGKLEF